MGKQEITYDDRNFAESNLLINSKRYSTLLGFKVIAIGLYKVQKGFYETSYRGGNLVCKIPAAEIREMLGREGNSLYRDLKKVSKQLMREQMGFEDPERHEFHYVNLVTEMTYKNSDLTIVFNGDLRKYLEELGKNYTILYLPLLLRFKRGYSFRLYELLKSWEYKFEKNNYECEVEFPLSELKFMLGCYDVNDPLVVNLIKDVKPDYEAAEKILAEEGSGSHAFVVWSDFRRYGLEPAIEEINGSEDADMHIEKIETLRKGKGGKIHSIRIKYRTHLAAEPLMNEVAATAEKELIEGLLTEDEKFDIESLVKNEILSEYKLSIKDVRAICDTAGYNVQRIVEAVNLLKEQKTEIEKVCGWLIVCIRSGYNNVRKLPSGGKGGFNHFPQRNYTEEEFSDIEKKMLGRISPKEG